jgi:hypothetical protein
VTSEVGAGLADRHGATLSDAIAEVMIGALDDAPGDLHPAREGWMVRREHWLTPVADAAQFEKGPAQNS